MSEANVSINKLAISARVTRKLREAGFANTSQLTNSGLDPWAGSLSDREAGEVVDALRAYCSQNFDTREASSEMRPPRASLDDAFDDVSFLSISTGLTNKLRRFGYGRVSEVKNDLSRLSISAQTKSKLREAIYLWESINHQERSLIMEQRRASAALTEPEWFPSNPLTAYSNSADLIEDLISEALNLFDDRQKTVLQERAFCRDPDNVLTLQALAEKFDVTRERVRQIEKKGLAKLRALIFDGQRLKTAWPRPELKDFWLPLHQNLADLDEISISELSSQVTSALNIPAEKLGHVMTLLTPLLTLSVTDPLTKQARAGAVTDLPTTVAELPVTHLRLRRATDSLIENDLHNIGDFYSFCQSTGRSTLSKKNRAAFDALRALADNDGPALRDPDLCLSRALDVHVDDFVWRESVAEAYVDFIPWFSEVIELALSWGKVADVFRLRTSLPADERMTCEQLGVELWGRSISVYAGRTERYILDRMTEIFVHKNLSHCPIHIPLMVQDLMDSLKRVYADAAGNYELFATLISHRLDIPESKVKKSSHLFWALLSGNLPNRYWHLKKRSTNDAGAKDIALAQENRVIKLKGFRSTY